MWQPWFLRSSSRGYEGEEIPRYPPFARGLPVVPAKELLASHGDMIERIRGSMGQNKGDFASLAWPVIRAYAAFVHLLPASESHHHRGAGGLLRHGLEVAFYAARFTESMVFDTDGGPDERRRAEPVWRFAIALGALLHDVGKPATDLSVVGLNNPEAVWNPYSGSIEAWAVEYRIDRYTLHWRRNRHKRHERLASVIAPRIVTREALTYLASVGPHVMQSLMTALAGGDDGVIYPLILQADQTSVEQDLKTDHFGTAGPSLGVPVERYILDAMRRLLADKEWKVNQPGARVWVFDEGVHLVWRPAVQDITGILAQDKAPGVPRDKDTLADILIERGFAVPRQVGGDGRSPARYWRMAPRLLVGKDGKPMALTMLRLASSSVLFGDAEVPVAVDWVAEAEQGAVRREQTRFGEDSRGKLQGAGGGKGGFVEVAGREPAEAKSDAEPVENAPKEMFTEVDRDVGGQEQAEEAAELERQAPHDAEQDKATAKAGREAMEWLLEQDSDVGGWLTDIGVAMGGTLEEGRDFAVRNDGSVALAWPESANRLGRIPKALLRTLSGLRWIVPDPNRPLVHIWEAVAGLKGILVRPEIGRRVMAIKEAGQVVQSERQPVEPKREHAGPSVTNPVRAEGEKDHYSLLFALYAAIRAGEVPGGIVQEEHGEVCVSYAALGWYQAKTGVPKKVWIDLIEQDLRSRIVGKEMICVPVIDE